MEMLQLGTLVKDIRGRSLGEVGAVRSCCVQLRGADVTSIKREAFLSLGDCDVELICDADQLGRYRCPGHSPVNAAK